MSQNLSITIDTPIHGARMKLPIGVDNRLQSLLDKQDRGEQLTPEERTEAEGLVELADILTLLKLEQTRSDFERNALDESADLYAQIYSDDRDLRELTESALLETVDD